MTLQQEIDQKRAAIKTDSYSMAISEWISLYDKGELDVHPEFQRFYRWSPYQKTRLIESILLGIPIPPIFVSQKENGVWDVVDGLQRLSTIFEFVGILKDKDNHLKPPLILEKTKYLPSLEGKKWETEDLLNSFDVTQRLLIKRSRIDVNIILRESDRNSQYELFQRLNTGGSALSDQEMRNALMIMINNDYYEWFKALSEDENFQSVIALTDRAKEEQYDKELALRFLVFKEIDLEETKNIGDVGEFLTEKMRSFSEGRSLNLTKEKEIFEKTFAKLANDIGEKAFKKYHANSERFKGGFSVSAFEVVACGLGNAFANNKNVTDVESKIKQIWADDEFTENSGSGLRASQRIPHTISIGRRIFR